MKTTKTPKPTPTPAAITTALELEKALKEIAIRDNIIRSVRNQLAKLVGAITTAIGD